MFMYGMVCITVWSVPCLFEYLVYDYLVSSFWNKFCFRIVDCCQNCQYCMCIILW